MADSIKYQNNALLICNDALALTCCNAFDTDKYWDAPPCDADVDPERYCYSIDPCEIQNRKYVSHLSRCAAITNYICECQRFLVDAHSSLITGVVLDGFKIQYAPAAPGTNGQINWGYETVSLVNDRGTWNIGISGHTLQSFSAFVNSVNSGWVTSFNNLNPYSDATVILEKNQTYTDPFPGTLTHDFPTRQSSVIIEYGRGGPTGYVPYSSGNGFATGLFNALNAIPTITGWVNVDLNRNYVRDNYHAYEIAFNGEGIIGIETSCLNPKENIYIKKNHLVYTDFSYIQDNKIQHGEYEYGWFSNNANEDYLRKGSGIYDGTSATVGNLCPLESQQLEPSLGVNGPYPYDTAEIQCCPQKGTKIGPRQTIGLLSDGTNGYQYSSNEFSNLENTILVGSTCYRLSPFFFLAGKIGRFDHEPISTRNLYKIPECSVMSTGLTNLCGSGVVPTGCVTELFLPRFSIECPWGPFGKYFDGIKTATHLSTNVNMVSSRVGWDYRPSGWMKTRGEWTDTKEIELRFVVHPLVPFYGGTRFDVDDRVYAQVDSANLGGFTIHSSGNTRCSPCILQYSTSGRTVGDFVSHVNGLRIQEAPGTSFSAPIFNFCLSHASVSGIPASKIINISSELYDLAARTESYDESVGAVNPAYDLERVGDNQGPFSGSDIFGPIAYSEMWPPFDHLVTDTNTGAPLYHGQGVSDRKAKLPPYGRHRVRQLPKQPQTDTTWFRSKTGKNRDEALSSPWWQAFQGGLETVISVTAGPSIPGSITSLDIECRDREVWIYALQGATVVNSGIIDTDIDREYTVASGVADLNNIVFTVGGTYNPVVANSGNHPFTVWLDDQTYWHNTTNLPTSSGAAGSVKTPINWSYREPLYNFPRTNLLSGGTANLQSWVRRRCVWNTTGEDSGYRDTNLYPCTPFDSSLRITSNQSVDCASDNTYVGNYIVSYGCNSNICKTEWYIKAVRCPCNDVYRCINESDLPHPFNLEGDDDSNKDTNYGDGLSYAGYWVNQPTIYICRENIHVDCNIPFLVKVPYQAVSNGTGLFYNYINQVGSPRFFPCSTGTIDVYYADGTDASDENVLFSSMSVCGYTHTPPIYQTERATFCSDCVGWCQYIDPANPTLVSKLNIPRAWPAKSYVVGRGYPAICSVNPYKNSLADVCTDNPSFASACGWDRILGVTPLVPPEYLNTDNLPCIYQSSSETLQALLRPMITSLTRGQVCGDAGTTRYDITCGTKCCECDFKCNPNNGLINAGPYREPFTQTYTFNAVRITNSFIFCNEDLHSGDAPCSYSECSQANVFAPRACPIKLYGIRTNTETISATYIDHTCGCKPERMTGTAVLVQSDSQIANCETQTSECGTNIYHNPSQQTNCDQPNLPSTSTINFTCDPYYVNFMTDYPAYSTYNISGIAIRGPVNCDFDEFVIDNRDFLTISSSDGLPAVYCNVDSVSWSVSTSIIVNGVSPYDSATLQYNDGTLYNPSYTDSDIGSHIGSPPVYSACPDNVGLSTALSSVTGWAQTSYFNELDFYQSPNPFVALSHRINSTDIYATGCAL